MPARASFDTLSIIYLQIIYLVELGVYTIYLKKDIQKKEEEEEKN